MFKLIKVFSTTLILLISLSGYSQIMTFDFNGLAGNEATAPSNFNDPNVAAGIISRGAGVNPANNGNRFNGNGWETGTLANAITNNHYMEFTVTPSGGCNFTVTSIAVNVQASGTGPSNMALRSSLDGYSTNLGAVAAVPSVSTFTFTQTAVAVAVTYRVYMYGASGGAGSGGFEGGGNDITVNGSTNCSTNTITTGALSGGPFTANCGAGIGTAGSVAFTSVGTFNGPNIYSVELSDATGSFASPTVIGTSASTANSGNIAFNIPSGTPTGAGYLIRVVADDPITTGSNSVVFTITQTAPCSITTGAVATSPFVVNCLTNTTASGTVAFTSVGTFIGGNTYAAELSDATGSFASPVIIGTLVSTANTGSIVITIPAASVTGAGYLIRITSSTPAMIGSNSAAFTITQMQLCLPQTPTTPGLIINEWSNGNSGNREFYEFVVAGQCGETVDIRGYILDDNNGTFSNPNSSPAPGGTGIAAGHFRFSNTAQWSAVPVGSLIVIYNNNDRNSNLPADDPNDSSPNDSLYVVPHDNMLFERCTTLPSSTADDSTYTPCTYATSPLTGWGPLSIANGGDAIQIRNPNGSYYHGVSYGSGIDGGPDNLYLFSGNGGGRCGWFNDGDFFDVNNWSSGTVAGGDETPGVANNALNAAWLSLMRDPLSPICPIVVLPVELSSFSGRNTNDGNLIMWSTSSERDASHFIIERSIDGKIWEKVHYENATGNSTNTMNYSFIDKDFDKTVNYYRLNQVDIDGANTIYNRHVYIDNSKLSNTNVVRIINILGQDIDANESGIQIHIFEDGTSKKIYHN